MRFGATPPAPNIVERAARSDIVRRRLEDPLELGFRLFDTTELEERPAERDPGREVRGMLFEAGLRDPDRLRVFADPPVFFGELRKSNRRRILLDPASKFLNPRIVVHALHY
jgi:hypothetical protein